MSATATWCEQCQHALEPEELTDEGACPTCGTVLRLERRPVPWTFKLMLVATVVYLGYRAYQGVGWLVHHL
jgi:uncharacterized paraquat-inducible protein A